MPKEDPNFQFSTEELLDDLAMIFGDDLADIAGDRDADMRDEMFTRQAEDAANHKKDRSRYERLEHSHRS